MPQTNIPDPIAAIPDDSPDYPTRLQQRRNALTADLAAILPPPDARFVFEVGCGHGHFLAAYAHAHPERVCIGIDIAGDRIERALRKRDRARLTNLHFLRAEARLFLDVIPPGARCSDVFVLFPDPWPKARHHKHRVLRPQFLTELAVRTGEGARLCFRTDFAPYFEDALAAVREHAAWLVADEPWPFEYETVFQSRAESFHSLVARRRPAI